MLTSRRSMHEEGEACVPADERTLGPVDELKDVLEASERTLGSEHPETLASVNDLAISLWTLGRNTEALPLLERVYEASERTLGPKHLATLTYVNNLAICLKDLARHAEALPLFERVFEAIGRIMGPEHPETLNYVYNLAYCLGALGRSAEALCTLERNLEVSEHALGSEHPYTLVSTSKLANYLADLGRNAEARPLFERVIEASKSTMGPDDLDTLTHIENLASHLAVIGRRTEALPMLEHVLEARMRVLGGQHANTLTSISSVAACLWALGRDDEALPMFKRALEGRESVLGPVHALTLASVNHLARCLWVLGRDAEALPMFRRAVEASERTMGLDHPNTLTYVNCLAKAVAAACEQRLRTLPVLSKVKLLHAAGVTRLITTTGFIASDIMALPQSEAEQLLPLVLRHMWPLLKTYLRDPTWRQQVISQQGLDMLILLLASMLEPDCKWYCRCSLALDAAQIVLAVLGDAVAPSADTVESASDALRLADRLVHTNIDEDTQQAAAGPIAEVMALWDMLLKSEELARVAATKNTRLPPDDARVLTSLLVGVAFRFKAHVKKANKASLGARARDALRSLLYSFVLTSLKARLCRADLFSDLEALALFGKQLKIDDASSLSSAEDTLHAVKAAGSAFGLLLCDWDGCVNMEGPSELRLVALLCSCGGRPKKAVECSQRYCSRACQAAAWLVSHKEQCPHP